MAKVKAKKILSKDERIAQRLASRVKNGQKMKNKRDNDLRGAGICAKIEYTKYPMTGKRTCALIPRSIAPKNALDSRSCRFEPELNRCVHLKDPRKQKRGQILYNTSNRIRAAFADRHLKLKNLSAAARTRATANYAQFKDVKTPQDLYAQRKAQWAAL